ncbi:anti-sigma factor [Devosia sp. 2618]|uniref:anti-sigma factor n=1 Tax=Devosia sp. 2618 TaxID=3156454 RepID=UPI0033910CB4
MTRDEKLALAGDYVLGLLDPTEIAAFETVSAADPELAEMAIAFAARMNNLDETAAPSPYDPELWARIERQIAKAAEETADNIVQMPPRARMSWAPLQWLPLAASVVIALGVGYVTGLASRPSDQPTMIAILLNEADASPSMIIEAFADDSVRLVPLESFEAPEGQVLQVWTLPDVATGPVSLGTLARTQDLRLDGPNLPLPQNGQLYEITLEPAPGSPTGRPTGPILVKGFAKPPVS